MKNGYRQCAALSKSRIYKCKEVTDIDLSGFQIIYTLLELMTEAICHPEMSYSRLLLQQVSRQYDIQAQNLPDRVMAVMGVWSGYVNKTQISQPLLCKGDNVELSFTAKIQALERSEKQ